MAVGVSATSDRDYVYHFPGCSRRLTRFVEGADTAAVTRGALDAIDTLRGAWEPLSVEVILYALEGDDPMTRSLVDVARPHRLLVRGAIDDGVVVESLMIDSVITTENDLSRQTIDSWLESSLRDVAHGKGQHGEWSRLMFRAGRAWAGPPQWRSGEAELRLRYEAGTVVVPIERAPSGAWLSGPREPASDQPPIEVWLTNEDGFVTLRLTQHYSYWIEPTEPAAQRLDELVHRLRAMGWENES